VASELELEGRILLEEGKHDEAIASLDQSVALLADVEAYLHLARAYQAKAEAARRKEDRRRVLERARRACRHASDLDRSGVFQEDIAGVVEHLEALAPTQAASGDLPVPTNSKGQTES